MLAPIVHKLQRIKQIETVAPIRTLVNVLLSDVVGRVCGGVAGRVDALESVLEAVNDALLVCEEEAAQVHKILKSVRIGLVAGTELLNSHSWYVPDDSVLTAACREVCTGRKPKSVPEVTVKRALSLLTPRDKRTLIELCEQGQQGSRPGRLLLKRAATLLAREIRRDGLDDQLRLMSTGQAATMYTPNRSCWLTRTRTRTRTRTLPPPPPLPLPLPLPLTRSYLLRGEDGQERVYRYRGKKTHRPVHIFMDRQSKAELELGPNNSDEYSVIEYIEVAELPPTPTPYPLPLPLTLTLTLTLLRGEHGHPHPNPNPNPNPNPTPTQPQPYPYPYPYP